MTDVRRGTRRSKDTVPSGDSPISKRVLRSTSLRLAAWNQKVTDMLNSLAEVMGTPSKAIDVQAKKGEACSSGVGFGGTHADEQMLSASKDSASSAQARQDQGLLELFSNLSAAIKELDGPETDETLLFPFTDSCFSLTICELLRNGSLLDMGRRAPVYDSLFDLIASICQHPLLSSLLVAPKRTGEPSVVQLLAVLDQQSQFFFKSQPQMTHDEETFFRTARCIHNTYELVKQDHSSANDASPSGSGLDADTLQTQYVAMFQSECFKNFDIQQASSHHYWALATRSTPVGRAVRQRMAELAALSSSLPCNWDGSIAVRVDEADCSLLKVLIVGPTGTPYANGCFIFDVFLPQLYPAEPPKVHLVTTQPSTRFNPNLYADGSVCLSLLGTWAGPGWIADMSTILQVLVSIHALIFVPDPYFNEPGYEGRKGTAAGDLANLDYNQRIRTFTAKLAILDHLRKPNPCFATLIQRHFAFKRQELLKQLDAWAPEMTEHSFGCKGKVERWRPEDIIADIKAELDKLPSVIN